MAIRQEAFDALRGGLSGDLALILSQASGDLPAGRLHDPSYGSLMVVAGTYNHRGLSPLPETFRIEHLGVALHGWSFLKAAAPEILTLPYPDAVSHVVNIGVLLTWPSGHPGHDRYAPCKITDPRARGYHYRALGHIHEQAEAECADRLRELERKIDWPGALSDEITASNRSTGKLDVNDYGR